MSREARSRLMSRIRGKHTGPELAILLELELRGLVFQRHVDDMPGRPDFVFFPERVAVFVDGDFWHGFRFPLWKHKLSPKWRNKIEGNRRRDERNFRKLRRMGWKVVRIWEHAVERDPKRCAKKIEAAIMSQERPSSKRPKT